MFLLCSLYLILSSLCSCALQVRIPTQDDVLRDELRDSFVALEQTRSRYTVASVVSSSPLLTTMCAQAEQYRDSKLGSMVSALEANIRAVDEQLMAIQKDMTQQGSIVRVCVCVSPY